MQSFECPDRWRMPPDAAGRARRCGVPGPWTGNGGVSFFAARDRVNQAVGVFALPTEEPGKLLPIADTYQ